MVDIARSFPLDLTASARSLIFSFASFPFPLRPLRQRR